MQGVVIAAGSAAAKSFNSNFYVTVATVIPVLFLVLAVQAPVYVNLLKASRDARRRVDKHSGSRSFVNIFVEIQAERIAVGIVVFGFLARFWHLYPCTLSA
jgi:hypothetical protein